MTNRMKQVKTSIVWIVLCFVSLQVNAQTEPALQKTTYKVAVFAPLYLDSVFSGTSYRYGKRFPRFVLQGLDFVQGVQIALDSMPPVPGATIQTYIYDSKSSS